MSTQVVGSIANTDTNFNLTQAAAKLTVDLLRRDEFFNFMERCGVINREDKLQNAAGDTVNLYNLNRISSRGIVGKADLYSEAAGREYGHRSIVIDKLQYSEYYARRDSMDAQRAPFELKEGRVETIRDWFKTMFVAGALNQLGGNTATSITVPEVYAEGAFTGADLSKITLLNTVAAPTSTYKATGSSTDLDDGSVTSSHPLTMQDFQAAMEVIASSYAGVPQWNFLTGKAGVRAVVFLGHVGMNQLLNQARAAGADATLSQWGYSSLEGGKRLGDYKMIEHPPTGLLFCVVPDSLLPRGVSSNAEVANTRRAIICGAGALDLAFGRAFPGSKGASFSVQEDSDYKKLNEEIYIAVKSIFGGKRRQQFGFGPNASTRYDVATYVITHYSPV